MNAKSIKIILMIDDDVDDCVLFSKALSEESADVKLITSDGCKPIHENTLPSLSPDIILLDLNMPGLNGLECIDMIKASKKFSKIPIFIYSTSSDEAQIKKCYERGAMLYVQKPSSYNKIKDFVKKLISLDLSVELKNTTEFTALKF